MAAALVTLMGAAMPAWAQSDDTVPFYAGASAGVSHVSNVYRQANTPNSDSVIVVGLLGGMDQRYGRQHVTLDGSLQNNRYATNKDLNYRSSSLRGAVNWQTVGNLSGVVSAKSDRSLADFNIGNGVAPILKKNIETNNEYQAIARMGVATRYTLEAGWNYRERNFSAEQYNRFVYHQNTGSLGLYATPAGNVRLGLAARQTKGENPRYPIGFAVEPDPADPTKLRLVQVSARNDYNRDDFDFTTRWETGGRSALNTRLSRSRTSNSLNVLRDFSGTTGAIDWTWQATAKLQFGVQFARDTGQETVVKSADLNRVYTSWQANTAYAVSSKLTLTAKAARNRAKRNSDAGVTVVDALDDTRSYNLGLRWAITRGFSLGCQYDHVSRDNSVPEYVYSASSYGCTGQALFF